MKVSDLVRPTFHRDDSHAVGLVTKIVGRFDVRVLWSDTNREAWHDISHLRVTDESR